MRRIRCPRCRHVNTIPDAYTERSFGCEGPDCTARLTVNKDLPTELEFPEPVDDRHAFNFEAPPIRYVDPNPFADSPEPEPYVPAPRSPYPQRRPGSGMGIASVSLGVVAICFTLLGCAFVPIAFAALPCGILAIIFGYVGMGTEGHGMATAGVILGIFSIAVPLLLLIAGVAAFTAMTRSRPPF